MQKRRRREGALKRRRSDCHKYEAIVASGRYEGLALKILKRKLNTATVEVAILETRV